MIAAITIVAITLTLYSSYFHQKTTSASDAMSKGQYNRAHDFYAATAENGNPAASNSLANLYYLGLGPEQDFGKSAQLYFAAAKRGHASAQINLGHLYKRGFGVEQNPLRAFAWYQMSRIHGNPAAEYYLTQVAVDFSLSPSQIRQASEQWKTLPQLVAEGL